MAGYWNNVMRRRLGRRRALASTGGIAMGSLILAACGSDDSPGAGSTAPTGATAATGATSAAGAASPLEAGAILYAGDQHTWPDESDSAVDGGVYPDHATSEYNQPFDPMLATGATLHWDLTSVYEYLLRTNRGPGIAAGTAEYESIEPNLAASYEHADEGATYIFKLRTGVKLQNVPPVEGRDMTVDDWRSTYERMAELSFYSGAFHDVVERIEFPDEETMVMRLHAPYAPLPVRMTDTFFGAFKIVPRELNENPDLMTDQPAGTGPLIVDNWQPETTMEFRRHEEYWGGRPHIARWHRPRIPEYANRYAQFVAGNIVSMTSFFRPTARDQLRLRDDAPGSVMVGSMLSPTGLTRMPMGRVDVANQPYNDARVRIAMRKSLDMESITNFRAQKDQFDAAGIDIQMHYMTHIGANPVWYLDPREAAPGSPMRNHLFELDEAKKLMEAAGYPDGIELDYTVGEADSAPAVELADLIQDGWQQSGLVRFRAKHAVPAVEFSDQILLQSNFTGLARPNPVGGNDPDGQWIRQWHSSGESSVWPDAQIDEIIMKQRAELDFERRVELFKEFQNRAAETFLQMPGEGTFAGFDYWWPWVHNMVYPTTYGNSTYYISKIWLAEDMPRRDG